jgi:hypothetical protein
MSAVLLYAAIYLFALAPGLPLGFALFGRRHPAAWIAGAAFGYLLTALAIWAPIRAGVPSALAFGGAWLGAGALAWVSARGVPGPLVTLPRWTAGESKALGCVLVLTAVIAVPPFVRAGATDTEGNRYYRAYFTADFVWHAALTAEVAKFASPPRNPYLANRPIHYYWTYFLLPAGAVGALPRGTEHLETFLKVNACGTALLFVSAIFLCAWTAVPRAGPVAAGVALAILASSAEGAFALWRFWHTGVPLTEVRNLNIDALSNWWLSGLRIDGLQRCFWWVPQHSMAYALGLIALAVVNAAGSGGTLGAIVLAGVALGGSTLMNPFVGGIFSLVWGGVVLLDAARSGALVSRLLRHSVAALPVALAVAWCVGNQMVEGGGSALQLGWLGDARKAPIATLLLSLGPALVPAIVGVIALAILPSHQPPLRLRRSAEALRAKAEGGSYRAGVFLAGTSLLLLYFVRLDLDPSWVGFRAGQMFLVAVPALIARGLSTTGALRGVAVTTALLALLAGGPTTVIDAYNAQDITNFADSPIGPWTMTVTRDEHDGLEWLRRATPGSAIVQMEPTVRARSTWTVIPSFAQRRMAAGEPISLLGGTAEGTEYREKSDRVKTMYSTHNAQEAWDIARSLRIDYVWVDRVERTAYAAGVAKFDASPQRFAPAFKNAEVSIYRVQ